MRVPGAQSACVCVVAGSGWVRVRALVRSSGAELRRRSLVQEFGAEVWRPHACYRGLLPTLVAGASHPAVARTPDGERRSSKQPGLRSAHRQGRRRARGPTRTRMQARPIRFAATPAPCRPAGCPARRPLRESAAIIYELPATKRHVSGRGILSPGPARAAGLTELSCNGCFSLTEVDGTRNSFN